MMRYEIPESDFVVRVLHNRSGIVGLADMTPSDTTPRGWTERGDGVFWRSYAFCSHDAPFQCQIDAYMSGNGRIEFEAPSGFILDESRTTYTNGVRTVYFVHTPK